MQVTVKFFSYLRQITGTDQLSVDLSDRATVADLMDSLSRKFDSPALKNDQTAVMINQKNAFPQTLLKEDDQVLLLPVMGGG
jgi:molybdopterin converting factor small subunit